METISIADIRRMKFPRPVYLCTHNTMSRSFHTTFPLEAKTLTAISSNTKEASSLFLHDLESAKDKLIMFLREYARTNDPKGSVYVYKAIENVVLHPDGTGELIIHFPINVFNGCQDVNFDLESKQHVKIKVDFATGLATLTGEELMPERGMDEI